MKKIIPSILTLAVATLANAQGVLWRDMPPDAVRAESNSDANGAFVAFREHNNHNQAAWHLFDGVIPTDKWTAEILYNHPSGSIGWVVYQFAGNDAWAVTNYTLWTANDNPDRDVTAWNLEGSNDLDLSGVPNGGHFNAPDPSKLAHERVAAATWHAVDVRTNYFGMFNGNRHTPHSFDCPSNTTAYRAYRLNLIENMGSATNRPSNFVQLAEWQMSGNSGDAVVSGDFCVLSKPAANIGAFSADTLGELVVDVSHSGPVAVFMDWGRRPDVLDNAVDCGTHYANTLLSKTLAGLEPGTAYYYRFRAESGGVAVTSAFTRVLNTLAPSDFPGLFKEMPPDTVRATSDVNVNGAFVVHDEFINNNVLNQTGWHLFDGVTVPPLGVVSKWCAPVLTGDPDSIGWAVYQFPNGEAWAITNYILWTANDNPDRDATIWHIEGSNDLDLTGVGNGNNSDAQARVRAATWELVDARTNNTAAGVGLGPRHTAYSFDCSSNLTAYRAYRLNLIKNFNNGYIQYSEWQMFGNSGEPPVAGGFYVLVGAAANIGAFSADVPCELVVNAPTVNPIAVFLDWGTYPGALGNVANLGSHSASTNLSAHLPGLLPATPYYYRFRADDGATASTSAWIRAFTTLGEIGFSNVAAHNEGTTLLVGCDVSQHGVAPVTVTLWTGSSPHNLSPSGLSWTLPAVAGTRACHGSLTGQTLGGLVYYQFRAGYVYGGVTRLRNSEVRSVYVFDPGSAKTWHWGGGSADIAHGKPLPESAANLSGTWTQGGARNWSVDALGSGYFAWTDAPDKAVVFRGNVTGGQAAVKLAGNVTLNRMTFNGAYAFSADANPAAAITLAGKVPTLACNGNITFGANVGLNAPDGFVKTGNNTLTVDTPKNSVAGTVTVTTPYAWTRDITIEGNGAMAGVAEFDLRPNAFLAVTLGAGANTKLGPASTVRMRHNAYFLPQGVSGGTQTLGRMVLDAAGVLNLGYFANVYSTAGGLFTFAQGIDRGPHGRGTLFVQSNNGDLTAAVQMGAAFTPGELLPWATTDRAQPLLFNAGGEFEVFATDDAPHTNLALWVQDSHYRINSGFVPTNAIQNLRIRSLSNYANTTTLTIADGRTLDIADGLLNHNTGTLTLAGGSLTTSSGDALHVLSPGGLVRIESALTGDMDLVVHTGNYTEFFGPRTNTFKGDTFVNGGELRINKTAQDNGIPPALAHPAFNSDIVVVASGGLLNVLSRRLNVLPVNAEYTVRDGGRIYFQGEGTAQRFDNVMRLENGEFSHTRGDFSANKTMFTRQDGPGVVFANGGRFNYPHYNSDAQLLLLTDVLCEPGATNQVVFTDSYPSVFRILLSESNTPARREWNVGAGAALEHGLPEVNFRAILCTAANAPVEFVKTGGGTMAFPVGANDFRGEATVLEGALWFNANNPFANAPVTVLTNGVLGGTAGHIGDVFARDGGALSPGTVLQPVSTFNIGGNLAFGAGGVWRVDINATGDACDFVNVAGDLTLAGECVPVFFNAGPKRPKGEWVIGSYGGSVSGKMSAPQGYSVRIDKANQKILFASAETGTLFMVR